MAGRVNKQGTNKTVLYDIVLRFNRHQLLVYGVLGLSPP